MDIGIIGNGVVGSATAHAFSSMAGVTSVRCWDISPPRCFHPLAAVLACDIIFVCLPTPEGEGGVCDTRVLDSFFSKLLLSYHRHKLFVLRSTVPVGYTAEIARRFDLPKLIHSPEFLTARTAKEDAANPVRNVIGRAEQPITLAAAELLDELYGRRWPTVPTFHMTTDDSEAVKLFQNSFSAVKIALFNEFRAFADKAGLDWTRVMEALLAGGWINPMHTQVPGPDRKRGFGGACLPKDTANLLSCMDDLGLNPMILDAALCRNLLMDREPEDR